MQAQAGAGTTGGALRQPPRLVDSHSHVQDERFSGDIELVLGAARLAGVERILVPGWDPASSQSAFELVERFPWLDAAVGIHPHVAGRVADAAWQAVVRLASNPRVHAIGETGLDTDRGFSPLDDQLRNLRRNLALALDTGKAAILHCRSKPGSRDAQDLLVTELKAAGFGSAAGSRTFGERPGAVIHSFSGPVDYARQCLDLGLAISFSGLVFRAGEESSVAVAAIVPADRLLIETDSPFLSPPGAARRRNAPEWVAITAKWLADRRSVDLSVLGNALAAAYERVFPALP